MTIDQNLGFTAVGYLGQAFFFARFFVQWWLSEKAKRIVVPVVFWTLSLYGGILALVYAVWKDDPVMIIGAVFPLAIYPRNLILARSGKPLDRGMLLTLAIAIALVALAAFALQLEAKFLGLPAVWMIVGGLGTLLWMCRFPLQWWVSERRGVATLPPSFFAVSLAGSILLLSYSIWTRDPVFILGQALTPFLNARNLIIGRRR